MSDLQTFVLGYLQQVGSLVEATAPGVHEVVLPDEVAHQWHTPAYQQIAFDEVPDTQATRLGYNHSLVEEMISAARSRPASTRAYITNLRLDKTGLAETARTGWNLPNSRVVERRDAALARARSTYVRFNFKAALISDEKHEQLVSVLIDVNAGYAATDATYIMQAVNADQPDVLLKTLTHAPLRWTAADGAALTEPMTPRTLQELLQRAQATVLRELDEPLQNLRRRAERFQELDEARLQEYYDEMSGDLQQRMVTAQPDRRLGLEEKLAAVEMERTAKLTDVVERYQVRLDLTLINLMVIEQPKLVLPVNLETRAAKLSTYAVWDPLLHRIEPLPCTVCGLSTERTFLCHHGHLAHEACLAPTCVDCKRVFCLQCADAMGSCAVCEQSLCRYSRHMCEHCNRGTCQAHIGLCHANAGQPVALHAQTLTPAAPQPEPLPSVSPAAPSTPTRPKPSKRVTPRQVTPKQALPPRKTRRLPAGTPTPQRLEVLIQSDQDAVVAYVLASRDREVAMRVWKLQPEGIGVLCRCELGADCDENHMLWRPVDAAGIEKQVLNAISALRQEYGVPPKKVQFFQYTAGRHIPMRRLALQGRWKDDAVLRHARIKFDRLPRP
ncbi:MAG: hypothetical protein V3S24_20435 [Candidatus Tectomicrobia bacterium]